jgi:uncharacterized protein YjhX (UPF0386 family)
MSKYFIAFNAIKNLVKPKKVAETITSVKPGKNLKAIREMKDEFIKMVDDKSKNLSIDKKSQLKKEAVEGIDKINKKYGKDAGKLEFKKRGGRIGFKKGSGRTGVPAIDIKSAPTKKLSEKQKKIASLAGNPKKIDKPDFKVLQSRRKNKKII